MEFTLCNAIKIHNTINIYSHQKKLFPNPEKLIQEFGKEGFHLIKKIDYLFGTISAQILVKN